MSNAINHRNPISNGQKPTATSAAKPERTLEKSGASQDSVQFSAEADELAAVDPSVCGNNWRCLEALNLRGLLG